MKIVLIESRAFQLVPESHADKIWLAHFFLLADKKLSNLIDVNYHKSDGENGGYGATVEDWIKDYKDWEDWNDFYGCDEFADGLESIDFNCYPD